METLRTRDVDRRISFLDGLGFSRLLLYWVGNGTSTNLTADDLRPLEPVVARGYKLFHSAGRKKKQLDWIQNVIVILSTDKSSQSVENNEEFNGFCKEKKTFPSKLSRKKEPHCNGFTGRNSSSFSMIQLVAIQLSFLRLSSKFPLSNHQSAIFCVTGRSGSIRPDKQTHTLTNVLTREEKLQVTIKNLLHP